MQNLRDSGSYRYWADLKQKTFHRSTTKKRTDVKNRNGSKSMNPILDLKYNLN